MSAYTEINIKEGMPLASEAMVNLKAAVDRCRCERYKCMLVIHGTAVRVKAV